MCDAGAAEELDGFVIMHGLDQLVAPQDPPVEDPSAVRASLPCGCAITYEATGPRMWARRPCGHIARSHPTDRQPCDGCPCCGWRPSNTRSVLREETR